MISPEYIQQGLVQRGMPAHIAQGFVMNMQDESGLNPGINEVSPTVPGSRGGYGLYQLTGPRRVAYESYAQRRGVALDDADAQLDFLMSELGSTEKRAAQSIFSTENPQDAAVAIARDFLRPSASNLEKRVNRYRGSSSMMQQEQKPRGLLGSLGIQRMEEGAAGETGERFYERDTFKDTAATLAQGFAALGSRPGLQKMAADVAAQRTEGKAKNRTIEYLRKAGRDDLASAVESGALGVRDAAKMMFAQPKTSAAEQQIQRLMSTGLPRETAIGITDGRLVVSRDPVTGEAVIVDKAQLMSQEAGQTAPVESVPEGDEPAGAFEGTNVRGALGATGLAAGVINTIADAFGQQQPADKISDASTALEDLSITTMLGLSAEFPGRPSNLTREKIEELTIKPGEFGLGPGRALNKAENMVRTIEQSLAAANSVLQGRASATDKAAAQQSIRALTPLLQDYNSLLTQLQPATPAAGGGAALRQEVADRLGAYN